MPLISVIIASYNHAPYVQDCLRSALSQGEGNLEILVTDDGSTDATAQVAAEHGATVLGAPYSMGNGAAIKRGARHASGEILMPASAKGAVI